MAVLSCTPHNFIPVDKIDEPELPDLYTLDGYTLEYHFDNNGVLDNATLGDNSRLSPEPTEKVEIFAKKDGKYLTTNDYVAVFKSADETDPKVVNVIESNPNGSPVSFIVEPKGNGETVFRIDFKIINGKKTETVIRRTHVIEYSGIEPEIEIVAKNHDGDAGTTLTSNATGSVSDTPYGYQQSRSSGTSSMTFYRDGTFSSNWSDCSDYMNQMGLRYGEGGPGIDHKDYSFRADFKFTKESQARDGYVGIHGWTVEPLTEYFIIEDWYGDMPTENQLGKYMGSLNVDNARYRTYVSLMENEKSPLGVETFPRICAIRPGCRQSGRVNISAHFDKWDELFTGQTENLPGSNKGGEVQLKFGKVTSVMFYQQARSESPLSGSFELQYLEIVEDASE